MTLQLRRRDEVEAKLRLRPVGSRHGLFLSASAEIDALPVLTLALGLELPLKPPHFTSNGDWGSVLVHLGCSTLTMRSPLAARAHETVPVAVHFC